MSTVSVTVAIRYGFFHRGTLLKGRVCLSADLLEGKSYCTLAEAEGDLDLGCMGRIRLKAVGVSYCSVLGEGTTIDQRSGR